MAASLLPASEREGLVAVLDEQRAALVRKVSGVSDDDARRTPTASTLSLLSLLKHCTVWEERWFRRVVGGEPLADGWPDLPDDDAEFLLDTDDTVALWLERYAQACAVSRALVAQRDLDAPCGLPGLSCNVRWVVLHMVEETARHCGHADLLREALDGTRGL